MNKKFLTIFLSLYGFILGAIPSLENSELYSLQVQTDGKIVGAGYAVQDGVFQLMLVRYETTGILDSSFGTDGFVFTSVGSRAQANSLGFQSDGKIVVAGFAIISGITQVLVARYNADGSLDNTFGAGGIVSTSIGSGSQANALVLQADGKIVIAGVSVQNQPSLLVCRYDSSGTLDTTFNTDGTVLTLIGSATVGNDITIDGNNKLVVAGYAIENGQHCYALARYNSDGSLDSSFDSDGTVMTAIESNAQGRSLAIQSDDKILVAGIADDQFAIVRYNTDGSLDNTYGTSGIQELHLGSNQSGLAIKLQADDKAIIGGSIENQLFVGRLLTSGALDTTFDSIGYRKFGVFPSSHALSIAIQGDGKSVVAGFAGSTFLIARFATNGSSDITFANAGTVTGISSDKDNALIGHLFVIDTTNQGVTTANTMQDITFNTNVFFDKWSHVSSSEIFTCNQEGKYLVEYNLEVTDSAGVPNATTISARALLNGSEVKGSQGTVKLSATADQATFLSRTFIVSCRKDDQLKFQFTGSSTTNMLEAGVGIGDTLPSAAVIITRIIG